jgi:hypothetical protein
MKVNRQASLQPRQEKTRDKETFWKPWPICTELTERLAAINFASSPQTRPYYV